jgi:hypothetical protein
MGTLLQLMTLPAACMLLTLVRHGGASAMITALCRWVAMGAVRHAACATSATPAGAHPPVKAGKSIRVPPPAAVNRLGPSKDARVSRNPPPPRGSSDASPRLRRLRSRWVIGNAAT